MEGLDLIEKQEAIKKMKEPTIGINPIDFETLKELKDPNFIAEELPKYKSIPIKVMNYVKLGEFVVFDNAYKEW